MLVHQAACVNKAAQLSVVLCSVPNHAHLIVEVFLAERDTDSAD